MTMYVPYTNMHVYMTLVCVLVRGLLQKLQMGEVKKVLSKQLREVDEGGS